MAREVIRPRGVPVPEGIPYSPGIKAGPFVFTSGMSGTDWKSGLAPEARVDPSIPYDGPIPMKQEARYIFRKITEVLKAGGSSPENAVRINHYIATYPDGVHDTDDIETLFRRWRSTNDHYLNVNWFEWVTYEKSMGQPASTLIPMYQTLARGAHYETLVIGIVPGPDMKKEAISTDAAPRPAGGYSQAIRAGQWLFVAGQVPTDFKTGVAPEARVVDWVWYGNEMRLQADYILKNLKATVEAAGASWDDVVSAVVYVRDIPEIPVLEEVWQKYFPKNRPARTIIPMIQTGCKGGFIEIDLIVIIPGGKLKKEVVSTDRAPRPLGNDPQAIKAGPILFLSGQLAANEKGLIPEARVNPELPYMKVGVKHQMDYILKNTQAICEAAGTSLENLVRAQCFYTDLRDFAPVMEVWAGAIPKDPPAMAHVEVPSPLRVPGCSVLLDLMAYIPE